MDGESPYARNIGGLQCAEHRVLHEPPTETFPLPVGCDGKAGQEHDGHGMPGETLFQALRRGGVFHLTHNQRVVTGDFRICQRHVCPRRAGLLVLECVADQEAVEHFASAVETFHRVSALKLFNAEIHFLRPRSKTLGSRKSLVRRGAGSEGASRADRKAAHCSVLKPNRWRSGSVSSARVRALSRTNSLTDRCAARAAVCRVRLADGVRRRSSFSLRVSVAGMSGPSSHDVRITY